MVKRFLIVLAVLIFCGGAAYYQLTLNQGCVQADLDQLQDVESERAMRLQLGCIYENAGLWEEAREEYGKVLSGEPDSVSAFAIEGFQRVVNRQNNRFANAIAEGWNVAWWIAENLIKLSFIAIVGFIVFVLAGKAPRKPGCLILPFKDFSDKKLGESMVRSIESVMRRTKMIHLRGQHGLFAISENLNVPSFGVLKHDEDLICEAFAQIDSLGIGSIDLPMGKIYTAVRNWLNLRERVITGGLYKYGNTLRMTAEVKDTRDGKVVHVWEVSAATQDEDLSVIVELEKKVAFQILYDLCPDLQAASWKSLQLFSEALQEMQMFETEDSDLVILEKAAEKLEKLVVLDPGYTLARYNLGMVYNTLGRFDEAREIFKEIKRATAEYKVEAGYNLGIAYYQLFQPWTYKYAIEEFNEVIAQLKNGELDRQRRLLALAHCGLAAVYAEMVKQNGKANFQLAQGNSARALELGAPDEEIQAFAHAALASAYLNSSQVDKAIEEFEASILLKPNYHSAYTSLGNAYLQKGQAQEAVRYFKRAIGLNPRNDYAHYRLGVAYKKLDEIGLASEEFKKAPKIADAHNELGKIMANRGQYDEALAEFERATELNNKLSEAWTNWAWYCIEAGRTDESSLEKAVERARRARDIEAEQKKSSYLWHRQDVLGWVYLNQKRWEKAEKEFRKSIDLDLARPQSRYHLALLYMQLEKYDEAKEQLFKLFEIPGDGFWRDKAEELMEELQGKEAT
jgi:tetratricopeptide (TPR) repeat protein